MLLGKYTQAIEYDQQWLTITRQIGDRQGEGQALGNLGSASMLLGKYPQAIEYQKQSLKVAHEMNNQQGECNALGSLGSAYDSLGDHIEAIKYHKRGLGIARGMIKDRESESAILINLGASYNLVGNYTEAIEHSQQGLKTAREIKHRLNEGKALGNLGIAHLSLGNHAIGVEYEQQALKVAREIKDRKSEGLALNALGAAFFSTSNLAMAEKNLFEGIAIWESLRKEGSGNNDSNQISIFEEQSNTYRILQQVLIAQNDPNTALEIAERGRARALVSLLMKKLATDSKTGAMDKSHFPSTAQIQQTAKAQNATLVEYSIIYDYFKIDGKRQFHEAALYIWVIPPNGTITFRQVDLKPLWQNQHTQLADLVTTSRSAIGVRSRAPATTTIFPSTFNPDNQKRNLQQLHKLLIAPIADLLPKDPNEQIIFIPQGELFLVPFPALQAANGKYLIENHTIRTAPAIQVLDLTRQQKQQQSTHPSNNTSLIVGNPIMPTITTTAGETPTKLDDLPNAKREAESIATLLRTTAQTGDQARKATILKQLPTARRIHFATHGLLDDFKGLGIPGAIALAPDKTGELNDGLLTAGEIFDLKLSADLVVLSACNTGNGKITGDGVIGLSRSLISAGVPSVVVSLWSVPDSPTADLMTSFYRNLDTNPNKAQALRQAMLTTMKSRPNPIDWAAFTLIGESE
jgi:CHAT domain-containing protein